MKNASKLLAILPFAFLVTNCGPGFESKLPNYRMGPDANVDIAGLPLEKAVRTKYTRLQLVCSENVTLTTLQDNGYDGEVISRTNPRSLKWDLLREYRERNAVSFESHASSYDFKLDLDLSLEMITVLSSSTPEAIYKMRNAASLKGASKDSLVIHGPQATSFIAGGQSAQVFHDRVPSLVYKVSNGPFVSEDGTKKKLSIEISCTLEAQVNRGFEGDWQEIRN